MLNAFTSVASVRPELFVHVGSTKTNAHDRTLVTLVVHLAFLEGIIAIFEVDSQLQHFECVARPRKQRQKKYTIVSIALQSHLLHPQGPLDSLKKLIISS